MKRRIRFAGAAAAVMLVGAGTAHASPPPVQPRMVNVVFRLQVAGRVDPTSTFWVAWGPLGDSWGVIQLHRQGSEYIGRHALPAVRGRYAFVMGQGTMKARFGPAPGNPVVVIRVVGPVTIGNGPQPTIHYQAPIG